MSMELDMSYVRSPCLLELEAKLPLRLAGDRGKEVEEAPHFLKLLARIAEKVEPNGRLQVCWWILVNFWEVKSVKVYCSELLKVYRCAVYSGDPMGSGVNKNPKNNYLDNVGF